MNGTFLPRLNAMLAALLVLFYVAWWLSGGASTKPLPLTALLAATVPLLLLLPALWAGRRFGTTLAGFILPFHFAYAVMELIANPAVRGWVALQTFLSLLLMIGTMANLRQVRAPQDA